MVDTPIVDDALQKQFRDTFPSQVSSGRDLHVSDVIIPIVDFSTQAAGSSLSTDLARAIDYSMGNFMVEGTTASTIINTTGFWRIIGSVSVVPDVTAGATNDGGQLILNDGTTDKVVFQYRNNNGRGTDRNAGNMTSFDIIVYVHTNHSVKAVCPNIRGVISGTYRQVADISGTTTNPLNFTST
tara:strand:+ start:84 stop:635 length:552 start_codon:yes stop_codon:yes gene_type:complete